VSRAVIAYPPAIIIDCHLEKYGHWPSGGFEWLRGLVQDTGARTPALPGIVQFQTLVCRDPCYILRAGFTRNAEPIEIILYFLDMTLGLSERCNVLELCAGTGILTVPLARYHNVVAIEKKPKYVDWLDRYLKDHGFDKYVEVFSGDLQQGEDIIGSLRSPRFDTVLMNPPWNLITEAFAIARGVDPQVILAVMPLDVLQEVEVENSYRCKDVEDIRENRRVVDDMRRGEDWRLVAVEPILREDGTAQIGVFLFRRSLTNRTGNSMSAPSR